MVGHPSLWIHLYTIVVVGQHTKGYGWMDRREQMVEKPQAIAYWEFKSIPLWPNQSIQHLCPKWLECKVSQHLHLRYLFLCTTTHQQIVWRFITFHGWIFTPLHKMERVSCWIKQVLKWIKPAADMLPNRQTQNWGWRRKRESELCYIMAKLCAFN